MKLRKVWISDWPDGNGRPSGFIKVCMRVSKKDYYSLGDTRESIMLEVDEFPIDRKNLEAGTEMHLALGLLDQDSLELLYNAIVKYFNSGD